VRFDNEEDVQCLLDKLFTRGCRHIDTARDYHGSEALLGRVNATSRFTIDTKVQGGFPGSHEPLKIDRSVRKSLDDLKAPSVETMYLHVPDRETPFEDVADVMNKCILRGEFSKFGLSNYTAEEVRKFIIICEEKGYVKPSVYQGHYNAIVRGGEKDLMPLLRKHRMAFYAYRYSTEISLPLVLSS
jgi:aflatoxin B1 aldehyde reductase